MANIKYRSLDATREEIRILTVIHPSPKEMSDEVHRNNDVRKAEEVQFALDHYPLQNWRSHQEHDHLCSGSGCFVALSYTWGDPDDLDQIVVDGYAVPVQANLKKALLALSRTDFVRQGCKVWADALCINQSDISERNREIKRMRNIYRNCWNVVVWLGDADGDSDAAIDFINGISDTVSQESGVTREYFRSYLDTGRGVTIWQCLSNLICRPYFWRLWIIQEIAMGRFESPILCGGKTTTWEKLYHAYHDLSADTYVPVDSSKSSTASNSRIAALFHEEIVTHPEALYAYKNINFWEWAKCEDFCVIQGVRHPSWPKVFEGVLLTRCRNARCENPLDKVYGMLALVNYRLAEATTVDYKKDVVTTYTAFSKAWLETHESLELLKFCGASGEHYVCDELLPSWVVDLRQEVKLQVGNYHPGFYVHGGRPSTFSINDSTLAAKGVIFDHVDGCSGVWYDNFNNCTDVTSSTSAANPYGADIDFQGALWQVFNQSRERVGDPGRRAYKDPAYRIVLDSAILDPQHGPPYPVPDEQGTDNSARWNWYLWVKRNANFALGGRPFKDWLDNNHALRDDPRNYHAALARVGYTLWYRRMITTEKGYIGKASRPVKRGDVVAVLWGCSVPLLLRKCFVNDQSKNVYRIVGECYIQGIMNGEIVQQVKMGTCTEENIDIC